MARIVAPAASLFRWDSSTSRVLMFATIAAGDLTPTTAEINASSTIDITGLMLTSGGITGFETSTEKTVVGSWGTDAIPQTVTGPRTIAESALMTKASKDGVDLRALVDPGEVVYLAFMPSGVVAGTKMEVWKVSCSNHTVSKATGQEGRLTTEFDIIDGNEFVTVPALS